MRLIRTSLLLLCGCGVSTVEVRDEVAGQASPSPLDIESPRPTPTPTRDAGNSSSSDDLPLFDAGVPELPRDAGLPEVPRDAGVPELPRDAGTPNECTPNTRRSCSTTCGSTSTQLCEQGSWSRCEVPHEVCGDGIDNDCDGRTDDRDTDCPPPRRRCEDTEGGSCNGDLGYGDHCAPSDNTGGCSAARFHAWCNRRNPSMPNVWYQWIQEWVDSRCDGTLAETGTQYSTWYCVSSNNERFECTTPLVLTFDGAPVRFERTHGEFAFTPRMPVHTDWPAAVTPWLVRDVNGNGRVDDGSELFGSDTRLRDGRTATHGFEALAELDENRDGVIDARDTAFSSLLLWSDVDGDRRSSPSELVPLSARVRSLSTRWALEPRCDERGNCERERSTFVDVRGRRGAVIDVYLRIGRTPPLLTAR